MHGVIFRSLREYVRAAHGDEAADTVFGAHGSFEVDQAYPDEQLAHLMRATIPNAVPPELAITPLDDDGVSIIYASRRGLCVLLRGLVQGTASHFGEQATLAEVTCMRRGEPACRFEVRLSPARAV